MSLAQRHRTYPRGLRVYGLDFSSAPCLRKPITCAVGRLVREPAAACAEPVLTFYLEEVTALTSLLSFEQFLQTPGPWLAGFDLPFSQPRALIEHERWPKDWPDFVEFFCAQDREQLRLRFKAWCDARPAGDKFAWRKTDKPAGSSPAMRWTNPPVAWMMHAGIARMRAAGLAFPAHEHRDERKPYLRWTKGQRADHRFALEAYPGFTARKVCRQSYKSDTPAKQDSPRAVHRQQILRALEAQQAGLGLRLRLTPSWSRRIVMDGSGDLLDAVICAMQAGHAAGLPDFGLPPEGSDYCDWLEGWIAAVPPSDLGQAVKTMGSLKARGSVPRAVERRAHLGRFAFSRFKELGLTPLPFQKEVWRCMASESCGLVHAPTGFGKTYAVWAGVLGAILDAEHDRREPQLLQGLQVLWITPMRALATDSLGALRRFASDDFSLALRTGDTPSHERLKQERHPPHGLVTTPESLSLMLSKPQTLHLLKQLRFVVVDEWHELMGSKRGTLLELSLTALAGLTAKRLRIWGLSATLGNQEQAAQVLCQSITFCPGIVTASGRKPARVITLLPKDTIRFAWSGHLGLTMLPPVLAQIEKAGSSLLFTNTRAQAELWYQAILQARPDWAGQMALHHGSLDSQTRAWVEKATAQGLLRLVVATSSLDLGVDFTPVEQVFQVGSAKGVARLLQRAGRSGHQPKGVSQVFMVPTHGLEILESLAAQRAIQAGQIEPRKPLRLALDVLAQHLVTRVLGQPMTETVLLEEVRQSHAFSDLSLEDFNWTIQFLAQGGRSLSAYPDFHRITRDTEGRWQMVDSRLARRHRQAIGTIVSDASLRLVWVSGGSLGQVEESFIGRLKPGDSFLFSGRSLELVRIRDLTAYVRKATGKAKAVARWTGGSLPLSGELASCLRDLLDAFARAGPGRQREAWQEGAEAKSMQTLLKIQSERSAIPKKGQCLVEHFSSPDGEHCFIYPFAGRQVHLGLASLLAFRLTRREATSISYAVNDYGFELLAPRRRKQDGPWLSRLLTDSGLSELLRPQNLSEDLLSLLGEGLITRRRFREIARVAGLLVMGLPGAGRSSRQLAASSNLLFEVFSKYDPENLLLRQAEREALELELSEPALLESLQRLHQGRWLSLSLQKPSPFCLPLMVERLREQLSSERLADRLARLTQALEDESCQP